MFKYCIVTELLLFMDANLNVIEYLLIVNSEPNSKRFFIRRVYYMLWSIILIVFIRWLF